MRARARVGARPQPPTDRDRRLVYKIASVMLCYPADRERGLLADALAAVPAIRSDPCRLPLSQAAQWITTHSQQEAERHHVATLDLTRRCCPYLTYYRYGDTRQRGMGLLSFKEAYRLAGYRPPHSELPDYLPVVLEFAAITGEPGVQLLREYRPALELLRAALDRTASPYAAVLDAVRATLPSLSSSEAATVRRLAAEGPPKEEVGLDPAGTAPFPPPEAQAPQAPPEAPARQAPREALARKAPRESLAREAPPGVLARKGPV